MPRDPDPARHDMIVHATPDPRVFGIECSCGERFLAVHGEPHVESIISKHHERHGIKRRVILL